MSKVSQNNYPANQKTNFTHSGKFNGKSVNVWRSTPLPKEVIQRKLKLPLRFLSDRTSEAFNSKDVVKMLSINLKNKKLSLGWFNKILFRVKSLFQKGNRDQSYKKMKQEFRLGKLTDDQKKELVNCLFSCACEAKDVKALKDVHQTCCNLFYDFSGHKFLEQLNDDQKKELINCLFYTAPENAAFEDAYKSYCKVLNEDPRKLNVMINFVKLVKHYSPDTMTENPISMLKFIKEEISEKYEKFSDLSTASKGLLESVIEDAINKVYEQSDRVTLLRDFQNLLLKIENWKNEGH